MPGTRPKFGERNLEISYTAAAAVVGGQLVERRAGTRQVGPAAAASEVVCGVATNDVPATRTSITGPQVGDEHACTVARMCVIDVTYAAAATVGQKLIAAANGQVTPVGVAAAVDARQIVGECFDATAAGQVGKALIY